MDGVGEQCSDRRGVSRASLWRRTITTDGGERGHRFTEGSLRKKSFYS